MQSGSEKALAGQLLMFGRSTIACRVCARTADFIGRYSVHFRAAHRAWPLRGNPRDLAAGGGTIRECRAQCHGEAEAGDQSLRAHRQPSGPSTAIRRARRSFPATPQFSDSCPGHIGERGTETGTRRFGSRCSLVIAWGTARRSGTGDVDWGSGGSMVFRRDQIRPQRTLGVLLDEVCSTSSSAGVDVEDGLLELLRAHGSSVRIGALPATRIQ
jgi:hypothetical protein